MTRKAPYIRPEKYFETKDYLDKYLPHYTIPYTLTYTSALRSFETGLNRKPKRRVTIIEVHTIPNTNYSQILIEGKQGKQRRVEVPYTVKEITDWYDKAEKYTLSGFQHWCSRNNHMTHSGRRTALTNLMIIHNPTILTQITIRALSGHINDREMQTYIGEASSIKKTLTPKNLEQIKQMHQHITI